jgi:uncharacterized protein (TIGR02246 family)
MRSRQFVLAISAAVAPSVVLAQQPEVHTRQQIEQMVVTFTERYNKQDAAGIATMFTKDAVRVSSAAPAVGPQAIEEIFKAQFKAGYNHIDETVDQVSPLGDDAAITIGEYHATGQGQSGPLKVEGRWTEVEVRDGGEWKIRLLTVVPAKSRASLRVI